MTGVESTVTAQPVIKDVQTLKANLKEKENEKRARSENGVEEVIPHADQQSAINEGEQRKRVKVSNPVESTKPSQEPPVLDGPLPKTTDEGIEPSIDSPAVTHTNGAPITKKDEVVSALNSTSPDKVAEKAQPLPPKTTIEDATSAHDNVQPAVNPPSEVQNPSDTSIDQPNTTGEKNALALEESSKEVAPAEAKELEKTETSKPEVAQETTLS